MSRYTEATFTIPEHALHDIDKAIRQLRTTLNTRTTQRTTRDYKKELIEHIETLHRTDLGLIAQWLPEKIDEYQDLLTQARTQAESGDSRATKTIKRAETLRDDALKEAEALERAEQSRIYTFQAVLKALKAMGCSYHARRKSDLHPQSPVIITADKPSGERISLVLELRGALRADLDGYQEGQCHEDWKTLISALEHHSGISITEESTNDKPEDETARELQCSH